MQLAISGEHSHSDNLH